MELVLQTSLEALLLKATCSEKLEMAAVEAFCTLISKEKDGPHLGVKVIAAQLPLGQEQDILKVLEILDLAMGRCGAHFQAEVGKFRFLNEMIKLVSPKYLGGQTALSVKQKVLQLLYSWTLDYPKETKIKEAFEMLRKQGVIREVPQQETRKKIVNSSLQDEEKSKLLQKLLQSKDPEQYQLANWLIKTMVKEETELKTKKTCSLESTENNVKLLNEMLDSYRKATSSQDELELIKELRQTCERLRPEIVKIASEAPKGPILARVLQLSDELEQVFRKYDLIIVENQGGNVSLLDLDKVELMLPESSQEKSSIDELCDIFTGGCGMATGDVLLPVAIFNEKKLEEQQDQFHDLDVLKDHLTKENLMSSRQHFKDKTPLNQLLKLESSSECSSNLDLLDDNLVDLSDEKMLGLGDVDLKLNDIFVKLEDIKPSFQEPLTILKEKNGITVTVHFTKEQPREDVFVFVLSTISKNALPVKDFLFQAVVPKGCKLKLQEASGSELPAFSPFLPPMAITQILLISNPGKTQIQLKFIVSYIVDGETITEMGEVEDLFL